MDKETQIPVQDCKEKIERTLKVVHKHYKKGYTIGFNLQGEYLKRFGFKYGDLVKVLVLQNRILIEKIVPISNS